MYQVFIDGKEGTTGLQIFERLQVLDDIEVLQIDSQKRKNEDEHTSENGQEKEQEHEKRRSEIIVDKS